MVLKGAAMACAAELQANAVDPCIAAENVKRSVARSVSDQLSWAKKQLDEPGALREFLLRCKFSDFGNSANVSDGGSDGSGGSGSDSDSGGGAASGSSLRLFHLALMVQQAHCWSLSHFSIGS